MDSIVSKTKIIETLYINDQDMESKAFPKSITT